MAKKPAARRAPDVIDVAPVTVHPDLAIVEQDGNTIAAFLGGLTTFFRRAGELERHSAATLEHARRLQPPTTLEQDVTIQTFIKQTTADKKAVIEHWTITSAVNRLHKRLVAGRDRAADNYDNANATANRLHNDYTDRERRRAAEEQDRQRRLAEQKAREDRDRELAQAEQQALDAEAAYEGLSEREEHFVDLVFRGQTPASAATGAGYRDARRGLLLIEQPKIQAAIAAKQEAANIRHQAEAIKALPLNVQVETVQPNIGKAVGGSFDRSTHAAELLDERALIDACIAGGHGIPTDILQVNPSKLNEYARSLHELINRWPGVRYKKTTKVV